MIKKYIFNNPGNLIPDPIKQRPFRRKDLGWKILWYSSSCIWDKELIFLTVSSPVTVGLSAICWDTESSLSGYFWMCFEWLVNSTSYSVKRFVLGLWCQGIQGFVEGGQVYPAHTVSGPCGEVICLTWRYQTACLPLLVIFEHRGQKKQWWHLSWAIMISPYNENVTYCSMTLCGPPQDDESWGPYVLPKKKKKEKKKHAFYKEGKTWNFLIKSQPVDRHSFWSSTVLCAMGKCQPGWAWHKQQTHLHNLVEWHKRQTQTTDAGKRGWDTHPFVVTYLICTHARANKTSYKAKNSSKLLWLQCAHVTRTIYLCFLGSKVSKWKTSWLSSFLYKKQTTKCTT